MSLDHLTLDIKYHLKKDRFEIGGNMNKEGQISLVENFLREQIGAGRDENEVNKKDVYHIQLKWYPSDDKIEAIYNTGNKGLRDGILTNFLKKFA